MSTPLPKHPFGLRYIYLLLLVGFFRTIVVFARWLLSKHVIHDGVTVKYITVPSRDKGRHIKVHMYQPFKYDSTKPAPVLINFHGSGFILPGLGTDREFCSLVSARTNALVFDADYRKAPEHPFPAAVQDAEDVAHYILANPDQYDPSNIFTCGFSAGGNLALVTASSLGPERLKGVICLYPSLDKTKPHTAPEKHMRSGVTVSPFMSNLFHESYILPEQSRSDPRISPIFAPTESFPEFIFVACGNADICYDPCVRFVERLKEAGHKNIVFLTAEYEGHAFDKRTKEGTESEEMKDRMYASAVEMINRALSAGN
jgi:acetyl esterase/lipase